MTANGLHWVANLRPRGGDLALAEALYFRGFVYYRLNATPRVADHQPMELHQVKTTNNLGLLDKLARAASAMKAGRLCGYAPTKSVSADLPNSWGPAMRI